MIPLGVFAKIFPRSTLEGTLDEVVRHDIRIVQFNFSSAGLPTLPDSVDPSHLERIGIAFRSRAVHIAAVSGTFNMIDPNLARRQDNLRKLGVLASACRAIGASKITLCTGTFDPDDMWRRHPHNGTPEAWRQLLASMDMALNATNNSGATLLIEPEPGNVISSAKTARQLLDELSSKRVRILFDAANLLAGRAARDQQAVLAQAFELLGPDIELAHGKEWCEGQNISRIPRRGSLDWDRYLESLAKYGYSGPLILHGFEERDANEAICFARERAVLAACPAKP